jgi:predicted phosphodiesterase
MIWGVFTDVHSNDVAFDAVLNFFKQKKVGGYICCGDIVGYGPSPNEVIERMEGLDPLHAVLGNHDLAVLGRMDLKWFNNYAQAANLWTRKQLTPSSLKFLESLNTVKSKKKDFMVVHGSPRSPAEEYLMTAQQFLDNLNYMSVFLCFVGHSHLPWCFGRDPELPLGVNSYFLKDGETLSIDPNDYWVVNAGSVGQPRDRDSRAACALYDDEKHEFSLHRILYDIAAVQKKMIEAGLPEFLAKRLSHGQ